ncbi:MAG: alpha-galactosidase [Dehalococcoidia bacterium]|nr:alpha-galactosidase [Dehalococcoidia bacterium]
MAEPVSSGLGRNGPWLQNRWLRVETRLDDGSLSPLALDGAFRPTERALASVQPRGEAPIAFGRCDYDARPYEDALGRGRLLTLIARLPRRGVTLRRELVLYDEHPSCLMRLGVTRDAAAGLRLDALHVFETADGRGRLQLGATPPDWRIYRHGWQSWSPTMSLGGGAVDLRSAPPVLAPEPPAEGAGRFASDDVGVLYDPASGRSMLAGAATARTLLTQIAVDAPARSMAARCLADGIALAPGETLWSERVAIDLVGTPHEQLGRYGDVLGRLMGARVPQRAPAGWCSWYYFYQDVTEEDVVRNLRFLERHRRELPVETVQIDDGYQADVGDWLQVNEKFPHGMQWLASEIRSAGYTPGIWLAPFLVAETSRLFAEHADWLVRDELGEPALAMKNWQRRNFALDGSHPEARAWLTQLFRQICEGWGYDYVKIDFLFAAAVAGRRHDVRATRVGAYRAALDAVRRGAGDGRFILGCGSLMAPSVGVFDGNRIGLDVAPFWRLLTHEERSAPRPRERRPDDALSAETSIRNTLNRSWMHGRLWANDPDCLLVRSDRTKLSLDETRTLASVIGLTGGMMLSSDDLERVPEERLEMISMLLPVLPRAATVCDLMSTDLPGHLELTPEGAAAPQRIVGLFNMSDEAADLDVALPEGRWQTVELWEERSLGVVEGRLSFALVAPHGCRVVALSPPGDVPSLVATTAHIGMGTLDVASSAYDETAGVLRLRLLPAGRARRRVYVACAGRRPRDVRADGRELALTGDAEVCCVDITVDQETLMEVRFEADASARER